jgi:hypothetical protein
MGTNYFVRPADACASRCDQWVHLGKSSFGWRFLHRAYRNPEWEGPNAITWAVADLKSWLKLLDLGEIYDEYGRLWERADFIELIDAKQDAKGHKVGDYGNFVADGCDFSAQEFS